MRQQIKQSARIVVGGRAHRSRSGMTARGNLSGFSFMEVMTAMFVVSVGLVTVIKIFSSGFINSATDRDRIVAAGLAQEGLEIVKNIRDNKLVIPGNLGFKGPFDILTANSPNDNLCGLDYTDTVFDNNGGNGSSHNCFSGSGNPARKFALNLGAGSFLNPYDTSATTTKWARVVYIVYNNGSNADPTDDSADVTSVVWWNWDGNWPDNLLDGLNKPTNLSNCKITAPVAAIPPSTPAQPARGCVYAQMHIDAWKP